MDKPHISIITINYNNAEGLSKTIESVINQTARNFEFIIIDGNSTDGSKDIINNYSTYFSYWISEADSGIYDAMNKGIKAASGEYLLFLNSGDYLKDNETLKFITPDLVNEEVISGDLILDFENKLHHIHSEEKISIAYFRKISLYHQATFVKKNVFTTYGLYNENFKLAGDYEFFIRILLKHNATYKHVSLPISLFNTTGISNSSSHMALNMKERELAWRNNFNPLILQDLDELYSIKNSKFFWIINKTKSKGFFYNFFSLITGFFIIGYRTLEKIKLVK